jgi:hypothetical protein
MSVWKNENALSGKAGMPHLETRKFSIWERENVTSGKMKMSHLGK